VFESLGKQKVRQAKKVFFTFAAFKKSLLLPQVLHGKKE
jgi:hypothetical protein